MITTSENATQKSTTLPALSVHHTSFLWALCHALVLPVWWLQTVPLEGAVDEVGPFGNQNPVCKPTTPRW